VEGFPKQLRDVATNYLSKSGVKARPRLKLIILSRPQPAVLESKLGQYPQIQLDDSDTEIAHDVERYIVAKVADLASEQNLSEEMVARVQQTSDDGSRPALCGNDTSIFVRDPLGP
jgi:hypothetical protein